MTTDSTLLQETYAELKAVRGQVIADGNSIFAKWQPDILREAYTASARNLAYYIALRRYNLFPLQQHLAHLGFSALDHLEADVLHKLDNVLKHMSLIVAPEDTAQYEFAATEKNGADKIAANANLIFGESASNSTARIMVTMPPHATEDSHLIEEMLEKGMTIARVNAAHESQNEWRQMVGVIDKARQKTGHKCKIYFDIAGAKVRIKALYTTLQRPRIAKGDKFFITAADQLTDYYDIPIVLGCSDADILSESELGDRIMLDDGKILGNIIKKKPEGIIVKVTHTKKDNGENIRATKGINFPDSKLKMDVLTPKDKSDIEFAKKYTDILGFSYIQDVADVHLIHDELVKLFGEEQASYVPITLKIETVSACQHLPEILAAAAGKHPTAVMIARGDLAVEAGYYNLAEMQEAILSVCESAHIPVIWATQVLESVAQTGVPTRSEITDVVTAARADVVMLNKGPYIITAIEMLNQLIGTRHQQYYKNTEILHELAMATNINLEN